MGRSKSSSSISFIFRIIFDDHLFKSEHASIITRPIPWILASETEKISTVSWYEDIFSNVVLTMNDLWNINFSESTGFFIGDRILDFPVSNVKLWFSGSFVTMVMRNCNKFEVEQQ